MVRGQFKSFLTPPALNDEWWPVSFYCQKNLLTSLWFWTGDPSQRLLILVFIFLLALQSIVHGTLLTLLIGLLVNFDFPLHQEIVRVGQERIWLRRFYIFWCSMLYTLLYSFKRRTLLTCFNIFQEVHSLSNQPPQYDCGHVDPCIRNYSTVQYLQVAVPICRSLLCPINIFLLSLG